MKSFDRLTKAEQAKVIAAAVVIALLIGFPLMGALARRTSSGHRIGRRGNHGAR